MARCPFLLECRENRALEVFVDEFFNRFGLVDSQDFFIRFVVGFIFADNHDVSVRRILVFYEEGILLRV